MVSRGEHLNPVDQLRFVRQCLTKLDEEKLKTNSAKFDFAEDQIEWLGHRISQSEITPLAT